MCIIGRYCVIIPAASPDAMLSAWLEQSSSSGGRLKAKSLCMVTRPPKTSGAPDERWTAEEGEEAEEGEGGEDFMRDAGSDEGEEEGEGGEGSKPKPSKVYTGFMTKATQFLQKTMRPTQRKKNGESLLELLNGFKKGSRKFFVECLARGCLPP